MRPWYLCKTSFWGLALKIESAPGFTPSFWWHERRKQHNNESLWWKSRFFRSDSISTIYPKSRFCTKQHKMLFFQGFFGFFKSFSRNAEKENCKFEPWKCNFVFELWFSSFHTHKLPLSANAFSLPTAMYFLRGGAAKAKLGNILAQ